MHFWVDDVEIISVDGSNLIFKGFRYENLYLVDLISMLVKLDYLHTCSLSLAWVGYGIEGLVMLE